MANSNNVVVAQSGGPSPVINSSLRGVAETCLAMPDVFGTVSKGGDLALASLWAAKKQGH